MSPDDMEVAFQGMPCNRTGATTGKASPCAQQQAQAIGAQVHEQVIAGCAQALQECRQSAPACLLVFQDDVAAPGAVAEQAQGRVYYPRVEFCTDNGAMIAYAGYLRLRAAQSEDLAIRAIPRWPLDSLPGLEKT